LPHFPVSTVTTASYRTCTVAPAAALPPCAGRRRRDVTDSPALGESPVDEDGINEIQPTAATTLIIGTTTISNPAAVSEYLEAHKPSSQSIIYPADFIPQTEGVASEISSDLIHDSTTLLYPSDDTPLQDDNDGTTELSQTLSDSESSPDDDLLGTTPNVLNDIALEKEKARAGLLGTTTTTTVIRVTSVATTIATGAAATLSVMYAGCAPPSYPITTNVCV
jgi:hypothetical protein